MTNELSVYEPTRALAANQGKNYAISCGAASVTLARGTDFGNPVVKKTGKKAFEKPILYKSGAEKLAFGFGLCQLYEVESAIEQAGESPLFFYRVKCSLVRPGASGVPPTVISNGYGSANTNESRNGFKGAYDSANSTLKMAKKRALVDAALCISGLSDLFSQDIENDDFMEQSGDILRETPESRITARQIQRIFAIAAGAGLNTEQAKTKIKAMGYASTKDILQKDYDKVCAGMEEKAE